MTASEDHLLTAVSVTAPVRIADVGGWTDTWFAGHGAVCHIGVGPAVTVHARLWDMPSDDRPVRVIAPDVGEDFRCGPSPTSGWATPVPGRQPLLEHAVAAVASRVDIPGTITLRITAEVPPGASLGTSASVVVAVVAALEQVLATPDGSNGPVVLTDRDRRRIAETAHRVETVAAGREAGVQDHWAAAFGGAQLIEITDYPTVRRTGIRLDAATRTALESRVVTVLVGSHDSSAVHAEVIASIGDSGDGGARRRSLLTQLSGLASEAAATLEAGDLDAWADVLTRSTRAQQRLHPGLVGAGHLEVIELARAHGAQGWKVNGAGGNGGSVTTVFASSEAASRFSGSISATRPDRPVRRFRVARGIEARRIAEPDH